MKRNDVEELAPSPERCRAWLRRLRGIVGPAFHPDTSAANYLRDDGTVLFDLQTARRVDRGVALAATVLGDLIYDDATYAEKVPT